MTTFLWLISFGIPLAPVFMVRWSRWLAIVQQKEYRLDRIWSYLQSPEGQVDAWRVLPRLSEFSRTGLKRPVRTVRILIVALISFVLFSVLLLPAVLFGNVIAVVMTVLLIYMFIPFLLLLSCLPTTLVSAAVTWKTLFQAQQKVRRHAPTIIGLGGSYGKTSTKHLLHHVLAQKQTVFVTPKSHNTKYSVAKSICVGYTNQKIALLEYGAYTRGEIAYMTQWFPPHYAVETGFTLQHLGLFGSEENSLLAESELVAAVPAGGQVFYHAADPGAKKICELGSKENQVALVPYSGPESVVKLEKPELNAKGQLSFEWKKKRVQTALVGKHYLINVQGVIAVAEALGMTPKEIEEALQSFVPNSSFIQTKSLADESVLIDDGGTSNPKGFAAAIDLADELKLKKKILVATGIVDLGDESDKVHHELAAAAKKVFDEVWYLGQAGLSEFQSVFGESCLTDQSQVLTALKQLPPQTLIIIEGRMPKWFNEAI